MRSSARTSCTIATRRASWSCRVPRLPGRHQALNAALAVAMLRHQDAARGAGLGAAARRWAGPTGRRGCSGSARARSTGLLPTGSELGSTAATIRPRRGWSPIRPPRLARRPAAALAVRRAASQGCGRRRSSPSPASPTRPHCAHPRPRKPRPERACRDGPRHGLQGLSARKPRPSAGAIRKPARGPGLRLALPRRRGAGGQRQCPTSSSRCPLALDAGGADRAVDQAAAASSTRTAGCRAARGQRRQQVEVHIAHGLDQRARGGSGQEPADDARRRRDQGILARR